jgi:PAS domain S-box-containing protein
MCKSLLPMDNYDYYMSRIEALLRENHKGMTVSDMALVLSMSRNTIGKYLELMYLSGVVDVRSIGKAKLYSLSSRVPVTRILSYISDAVIQTDDRYRIFHVNLSALDLLSADEEELIGRNLLDLLSIQGLKSEVRSQVTSPDRDMAFTSEVNLQHQGLDRVIWMTVADMVMYDGVRGHAFIFEDITEWKEAEEKRQANEFLFSTLSVESFEQVCVFTPEFTLSSCNKSYAAAYGCTPIELEGTDFLLPYDKGAAQAIRDTTLEVIEKQMKCRVIFQTTEHGVVHWLDARLFPVPEKNGSVCLILGIIRDVTGFQEGGCASALLTTLLDTMTEGVLTVTPGGTILSWNRGAEAITGYPAEELLGGTAQTIIPPELNGGQDVIIDAVRGTVVRDMRMTIRAKGGRKKKVILSSAVVPDHTGMISLVTLIWREP